MADLTAAQAAYDAANAAMRETHARLCEATAAHAARRLGPGWRTIGLIEGAHATRDRHPGRGKTHPVSLQWVYGLSHPWAAWAEHEGRDSDRCGTPDPTTESASADTPAGALLALADIADGMARRGRLPQRVADLRHLAQYCRDLAAECPEVADG